MITDIISLLKNENVSKDSFYMGKYVVENLTGVQFFDRRCNFLKKKLS